MSFELGSRSVHGLEDETRRRQHDDERNERRIDEKHTRKYIRRERVLTSTHRRVVRHSQGFDLDLKDDIDGAEYVE